MNWIKETQEKPPLKIQVLLKVNRGKQVFITQGFLIDSSNDLATERHPQEFWQSMGYGLEYRDYSDRLILKLNAKKAKSKVLEWCYI